MSAFVHAAARAWRYSSEPGTGPLSLALVEAVDREDPGDDAEDLRAEKARWSALSPREREIALALCRGLDHHEISALLNVGKRTVDGHRTRLLKRLQVRNNVMLALSAVRVGLVIL